MGGKLKIGMLEPSTTRNSRINMAERWGKKKKRILDGKNKTFQTQLGSTVGVH